VILYQVSGFDSLLVGFFILVFVFTFLFAGYVRLT